MTYIPPATAQKLATHFGKGERHDAMIQIAMPLIGNGMSHQEVFQILRVKFNDEDKSDKEIQDVIHFCASKNPTPSVVSIHRNTFSHEPPKKTPPKVIAKKFLGDKSEFKAPDEIPFQEFLKLYDPGDKLNIIIDYLFDETAIKARPVGAGQTKTIEEWSVCFAKSETPNSKAGAWFRLNPCSEIGTGAGGSVSDKDIVKFKFVLVESDELDTQTQLALYQKFRLPISAIVSSGANSYHAWIPVEAETLEEYKEISAGLLKILQPFGFDPANKNPSRLCRLPGAVREIGKVGDGKQRLLFINTDTKPLRYDDLILFEESLRPMPLSFVTVKEAVEEAYEQWDELKRNPNGYGVKTGIQALDKYGGLKNGSFIIVGAETNVGKSIFAMNVISSVLADNKSVAVFSMEMDRVELMEILFSLRASVDRTKFSTGEIEEREFQKLVAAGIEIQKSKLYIFESPQPTISDIKFSAKRMKEEYDIDLVVVDYLQLASAPGKQQRDQEVSAIGNGLRTLAKEINVPVLALSQLNDEGKLRESRTLSHEAHMILKLIEEEKTPTKRKLGITKSRRIPRGMKIELDFIGEHSRMVQTMGSFVGR